MPPYFFLPTIVVKILDSRIVPSCSHKGVKAQPYYGALSPERELSELNDTLIDILEKNIDHNNNDFIEGITLILPHINITV